MVPLFTNDREAVFLRRPNRFLLIAQAGDEELACHCPDPGRLTELCLPGAPLILEKRQTGKTAWTAVALRYDSPQGSEIVPLVTARMNQAARALILPQIIPGLKTVHAEHRINDSRFDFLCVDEAEEQHLVEVKSCSLVSDTVAMFPDAPSARALKHLTELSELSLKAYHCHVLFMITHGKPERFVPNLHTDPDFAALLCRVGWTRPERPPPGRLALHAALLECNADGRVRQNTAAPFVPIDLSSGALAEQNRGSYLIVLELSKDMEIEVGALGRVFFPRGWYVYAGSAQKNLTQRLARHLRKVRKERHWHLDYLTPHTASITALPLRSYRNLECELAVALSVLGGEQIPCFGSSDCHCKSHLFRFIGPPLQNRAFVDTLLGFRNRAPVQ
jgi:sugar fermentation stimulation protein A